MAEDSQPARADSDDTPHADSVDRARLALGEVAGDSDARELDTLYRDLRLKALRLEDLPAYIEIGDQGLRIGRDPTNDIVLDAGEHPCISGHHARFEWRDDALFVEDLGSKNGTTVNDARIHVRRLTSGDIVQLGGDVGVSFAVLASVNVAKTVRLRADALDVAPTLAAPSVRLGNTTIQKIKRLLGDWEDPRGDATARRWRPSRVTLGLFAIVITAGVAGMTYLLHEQQRLREDAEQSNFFTQSLSERLDLEHSKNREQANGYLDEKRRLESAQLELERQLATLRKASASDDSAHRLDSVIKDLEATKAKLETYRPVDLAALEHDQRQMLQRVRATVVFIRTVTYVKEASGERYLYTPTERKSTRLGPFDATRKRDLYVSGVQSGSGFCISEDGYIITNAHVVKATGMDHATELDGTPLEGVPTVAIVFSGTSQERLAKVVAITDDREQDFAIIKIEPFDGIPYIHDFTFERAIPEEGSDVQLFGFPLGLELPQGDDLTASIFRGSIARNVKPYMQVQSSVYPGNSGGPVIDSAGHVIGVVTAVHRWRPELDIYASDIGYVLPIRGIARVWPKELKK